MQSNNLIDSRVLTNKKYSKSPSNITQYATKKVSGTNLLKNAVEFERKIASDAYCDFEPTHRVSFA